MKIIYNNILPIKGFVAINLLGFVFARKEHNPISPTTMNHEAIHTEQMKEMLYVFFYLWYVIEWLIKLIMFRNKFSAYYEISFEAEACQNMHDLNYIKNRKRYSFLKQL